MGKGHNDNWFKAHGHKHELKTMTTDELLTIANDDGAPDQDLAREVLVERHGKPGKLRKLETAHDTGSVELKVDKAQAEPKCAHKMMPVVGVDRLFGSSLRGGVDMAHHGITVILAPETLREAVAPKILKHSPPWMMFLEHSPVTTGFSVASRPRADLLYWPWPDMKPPTDSDLPGTPAQIIRRIVFLHNAHVAGQVIEVACFGGHGRTGVLLAILAALKMGWDGKEAVTRLRRAYCDRAVETKRQEEWVAKAVGVARAVIENLNLTDEEIARLLDVGPEPKVQEDDEAGSLENSAPADDETLGEISQ